MASVPHSSWFSSLRPTNGGGSSTKPKSRNLQFKTLKVSSSSSDAESPPNSSNSPENSSEPSMPDAVKLAFARAKAYKESVKFNPTPKIIQNPVPESAETGNNIDGSVSEVTNSGGNEEVPLSFRLAMEQAKEYKKNKEIVGSKGIGEMSEAFSGTKNDGSVSEVTNFGNQEVPASVKLAMERAKEYKRNKKLMGSGKSVEEPQTISGSKVGNGIYSESALFERMMVAKGSELPAGLVPAAENFPEVEIIVGDASKFGNATVSMPEPTEEDKSDVYKPKVSSWGVFPRPSNISEAYGGGRVIRPGDELESAEVKAAKAARTRELVAAYRDKVELRIDPKIKGECEKALRDGDSLMDVGKLKEALPFYEKVMDELPFKTELHGLAALQWSICQDSLIRPYKARVMYEKLQSHPLVEVSKKAKMFLFAFQATKMLKLKSTTPRNSGYEKYFQAFGEYKAIYTLKEDEVEEGSLIQILPYIIFLVAPILIVLLIAVQKRV